MAEAFRPSPDVIRRNRPGPPPAELPPKCACQCDATDNSYGARAMSDRKIAIVTGANRGMGFEVSRQLGRLGFAIVMACRDSVAGRAAAEALRREGLEAEPFRFDITR